jgi:COMPASS component BRE2
MLAELSPNPSPKTTREPSPSASLTASRKRKRGSETPNQTNYPSPAPDATGAANPTTTKLSPLHNLSTRPRLKISRGPSFVPVSEDSPYYITEQLAVNRVGFRYTPAGVSPPDSVLPCTTIESAPPSFRISWEDRSPLISVTKDGLGLAGNKGFRSARCNAPVREGKWYMEIKIERGGGDRPPEDVRAKLRDGCHVRLGWGRREAPLNGPVGLDGYSYGIRDKTGEKVTLSHPRPYGRPFSTGDVIGMYISLPPYHPPSIHLRPGQDPYDPARIKRQRIAIEFKGQEYFESPEYTASKEMIALMDLSYKPADATASIPSASANKKSATVKNLPERGGPRSGRSAPTLAALRPLPILEGSKMAFFINGECQGIAFQDIYSFLQLRSTPSSRKVGRRNNRTVGVGQGGGGIVADDDIGPVSGNKHKENPFDDGTLGYYPFISLYNDARVYFNPGPDFEYPPPADIDALLTSSEPQSERTWRPIIERYPDFMAEQWALDKEEEAAARVAATARAAQQEANTQKEARNEKRRAQAAARRKAKKDAAAVVAVSHVPIKVEPSPSTSSSSVPPPLSLFSGITSSEGPQGFPSAAMLDVPRQGSSTPAIDSPFPSSAFPSNGLRQSSVSSVDMHDIGPASGFNSDIDVDVEAVDTDGDDAEMAVETVEFTQSFIHSNSPGHVRYREGTTNEGEPMSTSGHQDPVI